MKNLAVILTLFLSFVSLSSSAQEEQFNDGYIIDELFIYMHAGPGTNFRILGSVNAGSQILVTGNSENNFTQIRDGKDRLGWVENKYISQEPGLGVQLLQAQQELESAKMTLTQNVDEQADLRLELNSLQNEKQQLESQLVELNKQLVAAKSVQQEQNFEIKKQWFINGAIVLGVGLLLGLILPKLSTPKRKMNSWT